MILDKFHIFERGAGTVGKRHPIAVLDIGIRRKWEDPSTPAGTKDYGLSGDRVHFARGKLNGNCSLTTSVIQQQRCHKEFVESNDLVILQTRLKEAMQHMKAGFIRCKPAALDLHT